MLPTVIKPTAILAAVILAMAALSLYHFGLISLESKRSVMFIGSMTGDRARFRSCTGFSKRRLRFREVRTLTFTLALTLNSGSVRSRSPITAARFCCWMHSTPPARSMFPQAHSIRRSSVTTTPAANTR